MMMTCFLALGSNLGDRLEYLNGAIYKLQAHPDVRTIHTSPVYESEAHTRTDMNQHPLYLNAVISLETLLEPHALLSFISRLERDAGRQSQTKGTWMSRTLDLDILAYGSRQVDTRSLVIPHPRLDRRKFVLLPWNDLAPDFFVPPPFSATVSELLAACTDPHHSTRTSLTLKPHLLHTDYTHE